MDSIEYDIPKKRCFLRLLDRDEYLHQMKLIILVYLNDKRKNIKYNKILKKNQKTKARISR